MTNQTSCCSFRTPTMSIEEQRQKKNNNNNKRVHSPQVGLLVGGWVGLGSCQLHALEGASANKCAITLIPKLRSDRNPSSYKLFLAFAQNHVLLHPPTPPKHPPPQQLSLLFTNASIISFIQVPIPLYCSKNKTIARKEKQKFRETKQNKTKPLTHSITRRKIKKDHCNSHGKGKEKGDDVCNLLKAQCCALEIYRSLGLFFALVFNFWGF